MNNADLDWNAVRVFASVAEHGTLSGAASELRMSQPTVGRHIARLEAALNLRLFDHHQTGYALTADGQKILALADQMRLDAAEFERAAANALSDGSPRRIRIAVGDWGLYFLASRLDVLVRPETGLQIELVAADQVTNLSRNEADLALRNVRPKHGHLITKKIGDTASYVYGSEAYCRSNPELRNPENWPELDWVGYGSTRPSFAATNWLNALLDGRSPKYTVNRSTSVLDVIQSGCAVGVLPGWIGEFEGLIRLGDQPIHRRELWLTYHDDVRRESVSRKLKDRLQTLFGDRLQEAWTRLEED